MVGQWTVTKPSRSDEVVDADQQLKIADQIRAQFDSLTPKRPTKPNRSEPDLTPTNPSPVVSSIDQNIPELDKFRSLLSQSHVIVSGEVGNMAQDEFVETQYYKELVSIDKQHHTTGSGFIKVGSEGAEENGYGIQLVGGHGGGVGDRPAFKSNPATNDWIPSAEQDQVYISSKPNRSESC